MDSDKFLKEKLDNLNGQIDDLKREKKEVLHKIREVNAKKDELCNFISRSAVFNDTILFIIAKLLSDKVHESFRVFEYKRYKEVCVYPRMLFESTYIGIAPEENIKKNNNNLDSFFTKKLGYEIYEKDGRIIEPNKDCYDKITGYYDLNDLQGKTRLITFGFLLEKYGITRFYCGRYVHTNFDEYPYVQDFIVYLFNLQIQKNGELLTYEEISNAYDDLIALEETKTKTKKK